MRTAAIGAAMLVLGFVLGWGLRGQPPAEDRHLQRAVETPAPAFSPPVQEAASSRPVVPVEASPAASKPPARHREGMTVQPVPQPASSPPPVREEPTWHRVASFTGFSAKNTETFYVPGSQWRLRWKGERDNPHAMVLSIFVKRANGELVGLGANTNAPGSDVTYFHEGGSFWLEINTFGCQYSLVVESLH